jgi:hypothetical protein
MDMNSLLESLYENNTAGSIEKTAEDAMFSGLSTGQQQENPFMDLSLEELTKMAHDLKEDAESPEEVNEDLEKTAFDMLGGQIMAHAMVHEFGLMKEAMATGYCRVCKENAMDLEGTSICTDCLSDN